MSKSKIQILQDDKGKATGVFIPMNTWNTLTKKHQELKKLEEELPGKEELLSELKQAVTELHLIEKGKFKARPAKDLLNAL